METRATIHVQEPSHVIATWEGILLQIWRTETSPRGVKQVRKVVASMEQPPHTTIAIIHDGAAMPDAVARAELELLAQDLAPHINCALMILESGGFRGAAVRAVMSGLSMFTKNALRYRIFASVDEALRWLASAQTKIVSIGRFKSEIDRIRGELERLHPAAVSS